MLVNPVTFNARWLGLSKKNASNVLSNDMHSKGYDFVVLMALAVNSEHRMELDSYFRGVVVII